MKTLKMLLVTVCIGCISVPGNAQFFKKLKKKVENSVENTIHRKAADKASEETGKAVDVILEPPVSSDDTQENGGSATFPMGLGGSLDDLPDTYNFNWIYRLQLVAHKEKDNMEIEYYLNNDAPYWGARFYNDKSRDDMDMMMVYDGQTEKTVMFMDQNGQKIATVTKLPKTLSDRAMENMEGGEYSITKIAGKTIMGYACDGFIMENEEYKNTVYVTYDADVNFMGLYSNGGKLPDNFNPEWITKDGKQGLMMEMHMEDKDSSKQNMSMTCIKLEKSPLKIRTADYQSF